MIRRRGLVVVSAVAVAAGVVAACASDDDARAPFSPTPDAADDRSQSDATLDAGTDDASDARPDVIVDAAVPPVTCSVTPCAMEIATGADSACVRTSDGIVRCWGSNGAGELGRGPDAGGSSNAPAPVVGISGATRIAGSASAPGDVYCALSGGRPVCWGSNTNGVLGRVDDAGVVTESSSTPAPVAGLENATGIFVGHFVACATLAGNEIACWGANDAAQIPDAERTVGQPLPVTHVPLAERAHSLGIADRGTVALTANGVLSWGLQGRLLGPETGVLGREVSTEIARPGKIEIARVSAIAASKGRACAIANGEVYCWGAGPTAGSDSVYPAPVGVGDPTKAWAETITVGARSACATLSDGKAMCWGDNARGQLGNGNTELQPVPVEVQKLGGRPVRMAVMEATTCAILATGAVQCWGQNDKGQLGTGTADALPHLEPQNVVLAP